MKIVWGKGERSLIEITPFFGKYLKILNYSEKI
jgi:hypothetical protein